MRTHRKTGKAGHIAWRPLSSPLIPVLAGFPLAATGQNPDPSIGRPSVDTPIHRGTEIVGYSSGRPGYGIRIYATGTPNRPIGEGRVPPWGWGSVLVERPLQIETITAVQVSEKAEGFASVGRPVEEVTTVKEQLNKPTIDDPLFACQQGFWVSDLVEGVNLEYDTGNAKGNLWTPYRRDFVVPTYELADKKTVSAKQELPPYKASDHGTNDVEPNPLNSTSIKEEKYKPYTGKKTVGSDVLKIDNLITGAKVDIYRGKPGVRDDRIGGGIAGGSSWLFAIERLTTEGAWAEQSLCEGTLQSKSSDWAESKTDISPPTIDGPICAGATSVTVFTTEPGGHVKLQVKKKQQATFEDQGTAGTSGGKTVINYGDGKKTLADGDTIRVQHLIGSIRSKEVEEGVVSKSAPRFNIANGIPCDQYQCLGAGPRFVIGETPGPVFMASMCGIERNVKPKVEISRLHDGKVVDEIELEEADGNRGHFEQQWKKLFNSTELGAYRARFSIGNNQIHESQFYVTVQGCVDCDVINFHQTCVDRINKLRAKEGLNGLDRDETREGCSDNDAKVNFEAEIMHTQICQGAAQNECGGEYPKISDILDGCIEANMYKDEKENCWNKKDEKKACFSSKESPDCECQYGHYANIVNTMYKSIACGIYVTPDGKYKALMNFWP